MTTKPKKKRTTLRANIDKRDLDQASTAEVLLHAISHGDEDPVAAIIGTLREDLSAVAEIAEEGPIKGSIWAVIRRLDVALELHCRVRSGRLRLLSTADEKR